MSQQFITVVRVLHIGEQEEIKFVDILEKDLASYPGQSFVIEYTKFQDYQAKEMIMLNDATKYKKEKLPMIVLISSAFFNLIWKTSCKQNILNVITNFSTKNVLHIWLDVNEDDVKYRSTLLCRTDGLFRRIMASDLLKLTSRARIIKIHNLLNEKNGDVKFDPNNNHAIDDDVDNMRMNYEMAMFGKLSVKEAEPLTPPMQQSPTPAKKPRKKDPYLDAVVNYANMSGEDLASFSRMQSQRNQKTNNNYHGKYAYRHSAHVDKFTADSQPRNKKKKNKKKGEIDTVILLTEISDEDKKQIGHYLDRGYGANWKQLAESFGVNKTDIDKIHNFSSGHTIKLFDYLNSYHPSIDLLEFVEKCKQIQRGDVSMYISDNILNKKCDSVT